VCCRLNSTLRTFMLATDGINDVHSHVDAGDVRPSHEADGGTKRLLEAAEAGDERLVEVLAGVFAPDPTGVAQMPSRSSSRLTTGQAPSDQFEMTV
jgi:hypothetical protein